MNLASRLEAAERAAEQRLDAIETARKRLDEALGQLEALVPAARPNGPASELAMRTCRGCSREFMPSRPRQVFHSDRCRREHHGQARVARRRQQREQPAADPEAEPVAHPAMTSCALDAMLQPCQKVEPYRDMNETNKLAQARREDRDFALLGLRGLPQDLVERRLSLCRPEDAERIRQML
jgi:hypothetical protein